MKKIYLSIFAATMLFTACNNEPSGETAEVAEEQTVTTETPAGDAYTIAEGSLVTFYGASPTHGQNGEIAVSEGALYVNEGAITGGNVTVKLADMVVATKDLSVEKKADLKAHLLNEDFFNASVNPNVKFEITSVEALEGDADNTHTVSGNLSMNGKTNNISIPTKIELAENQITANAKFIVNRKDWGMVYKNDESLGDKWIYDKVEMTFDISATK